MEERSASNTELVLDVNVGVIILKVLFPFSELILKHHYMDLYLFSLLNWVTRLFELCTGLNWVISANLAFCFIDCSSPFFLTDQMFKMELSKLELSNKVHNGKSIIFRIGFKHMLTPLLYVPYVLSRVLSMSYFIPITIHSTILPSCTIGIHLCSRIYAYEV